MFKMIFSVLFCAVLCYSGDYKITYDYKTGTFYSTSGNDSRASTFDWSTGSTTISTKLGSSIPSYDYGTGDYTSTKKTGTGYTTYDYGTGSYSSGKKLQDFSSSKAKKAYLNSSFLCGDSEE